MNRQYVGSNRKLVLKPHQDQSIIEYPTITSDEVILKKAQIVSLYRDYLRSKENVQLIEFDSPKPKHSQVSVIVQDLNVHTRLQNKNLILKTQMRKYKNMNLYDRKRLFKALPLSTSFERKQKTFQSDKYLSLEPIKEQQRQIVQTVNSYGRMLLKIACQKPQSNFYFSKQTSPVQSHQSSKILNIQRPYASKPCSPRPKSYAQPYHQQPIQQIAPQVNNPKPTLRGWDSQSSSNLSLSP